MIAVRTFGTAQGALRTPVFLVANVRSIYALGCSRTPYRPPSMGSRPEGGLSFKGHLDQLSEQRRKSPVRLHTRSQALHDRAPTSSIQPACYDAQPSTLLSDRPERLVAQQSSTRRISRSGAGIRQCHCTFIERLHLVCTGRLMQVLRSAPMCGNAATDIC